MLLRWAKSTLLRSHTALLLKPTLLFPFLLQINMRLRPLGLRTRCYCRLHYTSRYLHLPVKTPITTIRLRQQADHADHASLMLPIHTPAGSMHSVFPIHLSKCHVCMDCSTAA